MADVAREAKVSKNTVSLALRNDPRIPEATRRKIEKVADKLGYRRDALVGELMAHMRRAKQPTFQATIAVINANQDPTALTDHPTIPVYVEGIKRRAQALGYRLDTFWMHDPEIDGDRLARILAARGIRGAVLVGMMKQNRLPEHFFPVIERFPCVVTGVRTRDPALSFACVDHHMLCLRAFEKALELGYKRPALVLDDVIDQLVNGRFTAGYLIGQRRLPESQHLQPFYRVLEAREDPNLFYQWMEETKPDVIFTLYNVVAQWLKEAGKRVPEDIGLIQLEWRESRPHWAGMNQHNDIASEAALDMLISMIHNREKGVPEFPRATLIGSSWVDGATVKQQSLLPSRKTAATRRPTSPASGTAEKSRK
jgi:LacI family transcriptional regulator